MLFRIPLKGSMALSYVSKNFIERDFWRCLSFSKL